MSGRGRDRPRFGQGQPRHRHSAADEAPVQTRRGRSAGRLPSPEPTVRKGERRRGRKPSSSPEPPPSKRGRGRGRGAVATASPERCLGRSPSQRTRGSERARGSRRDSLSAPPSSSEPASPANSSGRAGGRGRGRGRGRPAVGEEGEGEGRASDGALEEAEPSEPTAVRGYFSCKGRTCKSSSSVAELNLPPLGEGRGFQDVLDATPLQHFNQVEALHAERRKDFHRWHFMLKEGFNLLLYGVGTKRRLLDDFAQSKLTDGGVLMVNGFIPTTKVKEILDNVACMLLRNVAGASKRTDTSQLLSQLRALDAGRRLYIVLHNIDGLTLRSIESQRLLSQLAECPAISLVASMDHVDTPLLWDKTMSNRFNWIWQDATTFAPYMAEAALMPSLLLGRKSEQTGKGAVMVLMSLTAKARRVFRVLADNQDGGQGSKEQGISLQSWFQLCREQFLVTSEQLLRSLLTEFKDHQLVRTRKGADGTELYYIPLGEDALAQVLTELQNAA